MGQPSPVSAAGAGAGGHESTGPGRPGLSLQTVCARASADSPRAEVGAVGPGCRPGAGPSGWTAAGPPRCTSARRFLWVCGRRLPPSQHLPCWLCTLQRAYTARKWWLKTHSGLLMWGDRTGEGSRQGVWVSAAWGPGRWGLPSLSASPPSSTGGAGLADADGARAMGFLKVTSACWEWNS